MKITRRKLLALFAGAAVAKPSLRAGRRVRAVIFSAHNLINKAEHLRGLELWAYDGMTLFHVHDKCGNLTDKYVVYVLL